MTRLKRFLISLVICLVAFYSYPIIKDLTSPPSPPTSQYATPLKPHIIRNETPVSLGGISQYMGQSREQFEADFGQPKDHILTGLGYEWWIYGADMHQFFQVSYDHDRVQEIFVLGDQVPITPFKMGMELSELTEVTPIYSDFVFEVDDHLYEIELTEEQLTLMPLIMFDHNAFALLHMSRWTGELMAIRYLTVERLLRLMPYQLISGNLPDIPYTKQQDWQVINLDNRRQFLNLLSILRVKEGYSPYILRSELMDISQEMLTQLLANSASFFNMEEIELWDSRYEDINLQHVFYLNTKDLKPIIKTLPHRNWIDHAVFYAPTYDLPWLLMSMYNRRSFQTIFQQEQARYLGITFDQDMLLFVSSSDAALHPKIDIGD